MAKRNENTAHEKIFNIMQIFTDPNLKKKIQIRPDLHKV